MTGMIKPSTSFMSRYILLVLLVAAVYAATLSHGFVWDDITIIAENPILEKSGNFPKILFSEDTSIGFTGYYRPVTYLSFALDRAFWGVNPAGYHLTNLLLHAGAVLLFYAVFAALFQNDRLAFVAALIFALHPLAGESVNFLAGGRNTLLCSCFTLLSLLFYIREKTVPAVAAFAAAIFSKEFALLLPLVFLFLSFRQEGEKIRIRCFIPYLVTGAGYLMLRSLAVRRADFLSLINAKDAMKAPYLVVNYALNMIFPFRLKVLYDLHPNVPMIGVCVAVLVLAAGVGYLFRTHDVVLFSFYWFLLFLLPVINVIPLESASLMADRYAYLSLMGFALGLAFFICRWDNRTVTAIVVMLCAVLSYVDIGRNAIWKNEPVFFTRMTEDAPEKFDGYQNLGMYYYRNGDITQAVQYLAAALSKPAVPSQFLVGSASVFWKENRLDLAEMSLLRAMELEPADPEPYLMLITLYERSGNGSRAASLREITEVRFHGVERRLALRAEGLFHEGERYLSRQRYIPAENVFWQALMIEPDYIPALVGMGRMSAMRGDSERAIGFFRRTLDLDPSNSPAHYNLAVIYRQLGRLAEAEGEMEKFREAEAMARRE